MIRRCRSRAGFSRIERRIRDGASPGKASDIRSHVTRGRNRIANRPTIPIVTTARAMAQQSHRVQPAPLSGLGTTPTQMRTTTAADRIGTTNTATRTIAAGTRWARHLPVSASAASESVEPPGAGTSVISTGSARTVLGLSTPLGGSNGALDKGSRCVVGSPSGGADSTPHRPCLSVLPILVYYW